MESRERRVINQFKDEYYWLSNMYMCNISDLVGNTYPSVENAYQASKSLTIDERFLTINPYEARKLGKKVKLRDDWNVVKLAVMFRLLLTKFICNPKLVGKLVDTGDAILQEGNTWGDTYWGIDLRTGQGQNWLGKLLMVVREAIVQCNANTSDLEKLNVIYNEVDLRNIVFQVRQLVYSVENKYENN